MQTFLYLPANGIIQGMRPLIGYNYGAGEQKRVKEIYNIVLCMSSVIMVLGTIICLLIPGQLINLFCGYTNKIQFGSCFFVKSKKLSANANTNRAHKVDN